MPKNQADSAGAGQPRWALIVAGLFALVLFGLFVWKQWGGQKAAGPPVGPPNPVDQPNPDEPPTPPVDYAAVEALKTRAVGLLENLKHLPADPLLVQLAEQAPREEILPQRNLAINRVLSPEFTKGREEDLQRTATDLLAREPQSPAAHLLAAKLQSLRGDKAQALALLRRAAELAPDDPVPQYQLYAQYRESTDPQAEELAAQALAAARTTSPDNLFLLNESLLILARAHDPAIVDLLKAGREKLAFLAPLVLVQTRVDLPQLIDDALAAADQENWQGVLQRVMQMVNVVRPLEAVQSDRRLADPNPLEYILLDFSPGFRAKLPKPAATTTTDGVRFVIWADAQQPPSESHAEVVQLIDFNQDGLLDVVSLQEGQIAVWTRATLAAPWTLLCAADAAPGQTGLLVADLDADFLPGKGSGRPAPAVPAPSAPNDSGSAQSEPAAQDLPELPSSASDEPLHHTDLDVIVYGPQGLQVFQHVQTPAAEGGLPVHSLEPLEQPAALGDLREIRACLLVDFTHDGDLDLVVSTGDGLRLFSNLGNGTFETWNERSQLPPPELQVATLLAVDWDRDIDLDILIAATDGTTGWLENLRHGQMRWRPFDGTALASDRLTLLEADGNQSWDLVHAQGEGLALTLTETHAAGAVQFRETQPLAEWRVADVLVGDFDNDAFADLLARDAQNQIHILRGLPEAKFEEAAAWLAETALPQASSFDADDLDGDGDLDLALVCEGKIVLVENRNTTGNHWFNLAIYGQQIRGAAAGASGRIQHYGVGSLVECRAAERYQAQVASRPVTHFGLGAAPVAELARVTLTTGVPQNLVDVQGDQTVSELQTLFGSCPYLYTWTGEKYEFCTDLLWAAPLGLQLAEGVYAPSRPEEYILVEGRWLKPRGDHYALQITEELYEAAYYDQVELLAIDHPAEVQVFSNEKVGPAESAQFGVHTLRQPLRPVSARDQHGRDVLPRLLARDGDYLVAYDWKYRHGLTEDQVIELDLGPLENPGQIKLYLTGWIYPANSALNIASATNPDLPAAQLPALWTPGSDGQWRLARPFLGFPGGKTKTIVVDVSDAFTPGDYRLRITTNLEIRWDEIYFSVDEPEADFHVTRLTPARADLHYRGYSRGYWDTAAGPEVYDYQDVSTAPKWPSLEGRLTRYGDVTELVTTADDRLAIFCGGDEMSLEFPVPEPPPEGWVRDFFLHSIGWDKDCDQAVVTGNAVEPMPYRAVSQYPYLETPPNLLTAEYAEYLQTYQTREQSWAAFWRQLAVRGSE